MRRCHRRVLRVRVAKSPPRCKVRGLRRRGRQSRRTLLSFALQSSTWTQEPRHSGGYRQYRITAHFQRSNQLAPHCTAQGILNTREKLGPSLGPCPTSDNPSTDLNGVERVGPRSLGTAVCVLSTRGQLHHRAHSTSGRMASAEQNTPAARGSTKDRVANPLYSPGRPTEHPLHSTASVIRPRRVIICRWLAGPQPGVVAHHTAQVLDGLTHGHTAVALPRLQPSQRESQSETTPKKGLLN